MPIARESSRRGFMKMLVASPLLTQIAARGLYEKSATALGFDPRGNVFSRLGVKTVINCRGTWTYLSGSLQFPEVSAAQTEAARYFVNMMELQRGVGRRLAELTGAESGIITSGAAGAMAERAVMPEAPRNPLRVGSIFISYVSVEPPDVNKVSQPKLLILPRALYRDRANCFHCNCLVA